MRPLGQFIFTLFAHDMLPYLFHATDGNIFYEATLSALVTFILRQCAPLPTSGNMDYSMSLYHHSP
jgi:hypothetical protein